MQRKEVIVMNVFAVSYNETVQSWLILCDVFLQNRMDLQKDMQGSCSETNEIISIKVEDVSDTEEEEDPVPLKVSGIKTEHVVSFMSVCHCYAGFTDVQNSLLSFSSLSLDVCT
jgi:hypothetical protein